MKTFIIPWDNAADLAEIDEAVKEKTEFIPVKTIDEVLSVALAKADGSEKKKSVRRKDAQSQAGVYN
jgi:predicted ATP-dependent protease